MNLEIYIAEADAFHRETIALLKEMEGAPLDQRRELFTTRFAALQQRLGKLGWSMVEERTKQA